jgi:hypothetical protein
MKLDIGRLFRKRPRDKVATPGIRMKFRDVAFSYRMTAGVQGEVNRTHPCSIEPVLNDATAPVLGYGLACFTNGASNDVRQPVIGDNTATHIYGVTVRPYPMQQFTGGMTATFGGATPPAGKPIDVLKAGYILVPCQGTPNKGDAVFVWCAPTAAPHVQGGFETVASAGNTAALANDGTIYWNGPADVNGLAELVFNV